MPAAWSLWPCWLRHGARPHSRRSGADGDSPVGPARWTRGAGGLPPDRSQHQRNPSAQRVPRHHGLALRLRRRVTHSPRLWRIDRWLTLLATVAAIGMAVARVCVAAHYPHAVPAGLARGVISILGLRCSTPTSRQRR
ncbi:MULTISPECIES: phosphatase PAP2 family protein [Mycobacteriaceae]|uniref:phosphatase PAP2 family protein n=1 Tax=Mycobacteriaceae TaxID=1762 RepID=UPI0038768BF3